MTGSSEDISFNWNHKDKSRKVTSTNISRTNDIVFKVPVFYRQSLQDKVIAIISFKSSSGAHTTLRKSRENSYQNCTKPKTENWGELRDNEILPPGEGIEC